MTTRLVEDWRFRAACTEADPEAFFPDMGGSSRDAKKVCMSCDVCADCLSYALTTGERYGIYGGLSAHQRKKLLREARP